MKVTFEMESSLSNSGWITVFSFDDNKGFCHFLSAYLGEIAYGIERKMGITPKVCPIPAVIKIMCESETFFTDCTGF